MGERGRSATDAERREPGPLILSLETATAERSVAVARGGEIISLVLAAAPEVRTSRLLCDVDEALSRASVKLSDIDLFAVASGPGSFTGLRSGLATVKAFSATLGKPVAGVQTLHAVALSAGGAGRVKAFMPAGRGEFFSQTLSVDVDGRVEELDAVAHVSPDEMLEKASRMEGTLFWAGSGLSLIEEKLRATASLAGIPVRGSIPGGTPQGGREWVLAPKPEGLAPYVSALALESYVQNHVVSASALKAFYVRASDAEIKGQCPPPEPPAKNLRNPQSNR
jgi:tRNA threonylcarbamoyladenosine biosynthesis protein TsaB